MNDLAFYAGADKFSSLCGFRFVSAASTQYPNFYIAFNAKLRSKRFRQEVRPPAWRFVKQISKRELHVVDKKSALAQYGFDVDKFFQSDLFASSVPKFEATVKRGLDQYVPVFLKARAAGKAAMAKTSPSGDGFGEDPELAWRDPVEADAVRYADSIRDSLRFIHNRTCEDAFYKLIDYRQPVGEDEAPEEADEVELDAAIEEAVSKIYN